MHREEWKDIEKEKPQKNQMCEYKIEVTCKGKYTGENKDDRFENDGSKPVSKFVKWRSI